MYKLIIEDDEGHTTVVPLVKDEITIGRKEGNIIRLTERNVSRHHARLIRSNGSVFIEDLDSYNGVKVNGGKITAKTTIRDGDLVEIGDYHLALQKADQPPPTPGQSKPDDTQSTPSGEQKAASPMAPTTADGGTAVLRLPLEDKKPPEPGRARAIAKEQIAHLIAISTDLNGQKFTLDKTEITIGRTEDNDICLPHRSVSSNHAKIVFDGGVFRIIDLDSANGILVNSEEYARVDIRKGDIIELGHVKLKYVAPGEDLNSILNQVPATGASASATTPSTMIDASMPELNPASGKGKILGIVAAVAVIIGITAVAVMNWPTGNNAKTDTPETDLKAANSEIKKTTPENSAGTSKKAEAAEYFKQGLERMKVGDWVQAENVFNSAIKLDPDHNGAKEMLERVRKEQQGETFLQRVNGAIQRKDWDDAVDLINQIPEATKAAKAAEVKKAEVIKKYRSFHLNRADRFEKINRLNDAIKELDAVLIVDPKNYLAQTKRDKLVSRIKKAKTSGRNYNKKSSRKSSSGIVSRKEAKRLKSEGKKARKAQKFTKAISLFKKALKLTPKDPYLYLNLGISWASMGRMPKAREAYVKFLKLCPDCKEAPRVRQMVKEYDASQ